MSYRISCWTLFDITATGVLNRIRSDELISDDWILKRNTQCNFDTILQVISLRSQPEIIKLPYLLQNTDNIIEKFGNFYLNENEEYSCWKFEFEVQHSSVFENGIIPFGALYSDCEGVPMIQCRTQRIKMLLPMLNTTMELKNIHFEEL